MLKLSPGPCAAFAAIALLSACGQPSGTDAVPEAETPQPVASMGSEEPPPPPQVNSAVPGIRFLTIGMSEEELKAHDLPVSWGTRNQEGEAYDLATVELEPGAAATGVFDLDGKLYSLEIESEGIRDNHGLGVGSTLAEISTAYPQGRMIYGVEEGRHAAFLTGGVLVFRFDPADLADSCFAPEAECTPPEGLTAEKLVVFGQPIP